jgi:nitrogen fixation protein FixH
MDKLLLSLAAGVGLIVLASLSGYRFSRLGAVQVAVLVALLTLGVYLPLAILHWPGGDVLAIHLAVYLLTAGVCGVFLHNREQDRSGQGLHWGPAVIIGFFVCLLVLCAVFVVLAEQGLSPALSAYLFPSTTHSGVVSSGFPGVTAHDFQQKEALYNDYLQQVQRQQERGWQVQKGWLDRPVLGAAALFRVVVHTRAGDPLTGATVAGQFLRPADSRLDTLFTLPEVEPGVYQAPLSLPAAGLWELVLEVRKEEERHEIRASTAVLAH